MYRCGRIAASAILPLSLVACIGAPLQGAAPSPEPCSDSWFGYVEERIAVGDGHGHGPDIGSLEWMSAVEFKLGIRDNEEIPERKSRSWCEYVDSILMNCE